MSVVIHLRSEDAAVSGLVPRRWPLACLLALCGACAGVPLRAQQPGSGECTGELSAVAADVTPGWRIPPVGLVSRIEVRGLHTVPEALVREAIHAPVGELVDLVAVRADIRRILALAVFEDVRVYADDGGEDLVLRYQLVERPLIERVRLLSEVADESDLPRLRELEGEVFVPQRLRRLSDRVSTDYRREGYGDASVEVHAARMEDGAVDVCFAIDAGRRWLIDRFAFVGNERLDDHALAERMATFDGRVNVSGGVYRQDFLSDDYLRIRAAYYDAGMIDVKLEQPRTSWSEGKLSVEIPIEEGLVYHFSAVGVRGSATDPEQVYLDLLRVHPGEVFSRTAVTQGLERIRVHEREQGRAQVLITPGVDMDREAGTVALWIEFLDPAAPAPEPTTEPASAELQDPVELQDPEVTLELPTLGQEHP
ncbi:MAG: hypothetical protein GXP55_21590 [Deltaproteobacteria bacterium]|nr:hypothetical protein [Deltaproteobacteria bacterium]